jgi:hypothetical protein
VHPVGFHYIKYQDARSAKHNLFKRIGGNMSSPRSINCSHSDSQLLQTTTASFADIRMNKWTSFTLINLSPEGTGRLE